ncbi:FUSC family protein [Aeromicrobium sp. CF3.5]|uniref:FUSC family protein n=1 Tax=Aeromicrobium sp. CF3.5 TaxID=3373078 RepID=UPI003EE438BB
MREHDVRGSVAASVGSLRDPATQTDLLQLLKAVAASVGAWWIADDLLGFEQPFLAAWTALLAVHATIYRSFVQGAQSVLATVLGMVVAVAAAELLGANPLSLAIALVVTLLFARVRTLRTEGLTAATTSLFIITTNYNQQEAILLDRFGDLVVGVVVGVLVNLMVFAPLAARSAEQQVDRVDRKLGGLMRQMATEIGEGPTSEQAGDWVEKTREIDRDLNRARRVIDHAQESQWWNPRRSRVQESPTPASDRDLLIRLEEGVAQVRAMARVVRESTLAAEDWAPEFRDPWLRLLADLAERVADPDQEVASLRQQVNDLARDLSSADLPGLYWPMYGALISSTRIVIDVVDDVASGRPVRV